MANTKLDILVQYSSREAAYRQLNIMRKKNISLVMSTSPKISQDGRIAFMCVDERELHALIDIIREANGEVEFLETY